MDTYKIIAYWFDDEGHERSKEFWAVETAQKMVGFKAAEVEGAIAKLIEEGYAEAYSIVV